jgi:hypothetical protein
MGHVEELSNPLGVAVVSDGACFWSNRSIPTHAEDAWFSRIASWNTPATRRESNSDRSKGLAGSTRVPATEAGEI